MQRLWWITHFLWSMAGISEQTSTFKFKFLKLLPSHELPSEYYSITQYCWQSYLRPIYHLSLIINQCGYKHYLQTLEAQASMSKRLISFILWSGRWWNDSFKVIPPSEDLKLKPSVLVYLCHCNKIPEQFLGNYNFISHSSRGQEIQDQGTSNFGVS